MKDSNLQVKINSPSNVVYETPRRKKKKKKITCKKKKKTLTNLYLSEGK